MHGMPTATSRRSAAETARKQDSGLDMDPDADGPGVRGGSAGWVREQGLATAFDTRLSGIPALTGRASRVIARAARRRGYRLVVAPEGFLVSRSRTNVDSATLRTVCPG